MNRIKSKILNDSITLLEEGETAFFSKDAVSLEITEQEELLNNNKFITPLQLKNIFNIKKIFEGQILHYIKCPICKAKVIQEFAIDENNNNVGLLLFEENSRKIHKCNLETNYE